MPTPECENRKNGKPSDIICLEFHRRAETVPAVRHSQLRPLSGRPHARRGFVYMGRRGEPLSRPLSRLGVRAAGPLPRPGRRGRPRAVGLPDPRAQHLAHRGPGAMGEGLVGAEFRRPGILLQLGNRGQRGGHQTRAAAQHAQAPLQDHHLRRQLPRPHARIADRDGPAQVSRGTGAADGRFRLLRPSATSTPWPG